ncbi:MAG TPA: YihY family inner membrane protein [Ramlibacter sp.]|jgi:membrane protein|uniref:YihY family inner membrane protein n=1 Tax=Ramlibacter sp. TaxID=1917967 RepID=UPI002D334BC7|nr:YihY family inner membrane protein [Ramlibacter sp.]HZY20545.1 YihY family inner membrane protein [Ramlibacter sp.]
MNVASLLAELSRFPWLSAARTLRERFREDRLGLTASSLTFTTTIALVPMVTVALAVFTAFPMFGKLQGAVQSWLVQSLVPDAIARQVLGYLTQFAGKASRLGVVGLGALFLSALALVLTIDRTLNNIWRVRRHRPLAQRVLIYWAVMTLGPLLLGASISVTSYALYASRGLVSGVPGVVRFLLDVLEFVLLTGGLTCLYRFVPNTPVRPAHAVAGGVVAAFGIEAAKRLLAWYLGLVPTYSVVYGAFATVPILLVWIYLAWLVVLMGAVVAAYLPSLLGATRRTPTLHGWQFQLALEVLQQLHRVRNSARRGMNVDELVRTLGVDPLQLEPVLESLVQLDWLGRLNEIDDAVATRYVLLADAQSTAVEPLLRHLLLPRTDATARLWGHGALSSLYLKDVL